MRGALVIGLAAGLLACRLPAPPPVPPQLTPLSEEARVANVEVALSERLDADEREALVRVEVPLLLRVSALDWFEHEERFDPQGSVVIQVEVVGLSLRSGLSAWLWPERVRPDALSVRVRVRGSGGLLARFEWEEQTHVGGWDWREADARLERLARRLGRRIAELL